MESDKLYRVQKEDLPKVEKMLNQCFAHDPLYETLIPDPEVRKNLMPELFKCDMDEFYATCEIFADSADLNSVLVVSDEAEPYNVFQFYFTEAMAALQTDSYLIKEDPSLKTFRNFMKGEDYLNSSWIRISDFILSIWQWILPCSITELRRNFWRKPLTMLRSTN